MIHIASKIFFPSRQFENGERKLIPSNPIQSNPNQSNPIRFDSIRFSALAGPTTAVTNTQTQTHELP